MRRSERNNPDPPAIDLSLDGLWWVQEHISQADFEALELAQLTELWSNYGEPV